MASSHTLGNSALTTCKKVTCGIPSPASFDTASVRSEVFFHGVVKPKFDITKLMELHTGGDVDDSMDVERPEAEDVVNTLTAEVAAAEVVHSVAGNVKCRPSNPRGGGVLRLHTLIAPASSPSVLSRSDRACLYHHVH